MDFFHLAGASLRVGSVIDPGNWGRVIRQAQWTHNHAVREMAMESARLARFQNQPSRLECAFAFVTVQDALNFRKSSGPNGFGFHVLYRVALSEPDKLSALANINLCIASGTLRPDWTDAYWNSCAPIETVGEGVGYTREVLTLSGLRVEERFD